MRASLKAIVSAWLSAAGAASASAEPVDCPLAAGTAAAAQADMSPPSAMKDMRMDEPMNSPMAKPGTMMMDVTAAEVAKSRCMEPMLEHEQTTMNTPKPPAR